MWRGIKEMGPGLRGAGVMWVLRRRLVYKEVTLAFMSAYGVMDIAQAIDTIC